MRIPDVCVIQIGYTARAKLEAAADGVLAIQLRDVAQDGVSIGQLARVQVNERIDRYLVQAGDVLFRSRGERNTAAALDGRLTEPAIAVSPLMALRPNPAAILAEYLAWAINQPEAQRYFDVAARGTSIRMVSKASLDDLRIDVPDLETQHRIIMIDALAAREGALMRLLADGKRDLTNRLLAERAKRTPPSPKSKRTGQ
jgi:hypothetical protein